MIHDKKGDNFQIEFITYLTDSKLDEIMTYISMFFFNNSQRLHNTLNRIVTFHLHHCYQIFVKIAASHLWFSVNSCIFIAFDVFTMKMPLFVCVWFYISHFILFHSLHALCPTLNQFALFQFKREAYIVKINVCSWEIILVYGDSRY